MGKTFLRASFATVAFLASLLFLQSVRAAPFINSVVTTGPSIPSGLTEAKYDNAAASGDNTPVAGVSGQKIYVYKIFFSCAASSNITFKDGSTALTAAATMTTIALDMDGNPWFTTSAGNGFVINSSAATECTGRVFYVQQ